METKILQKAVFQDTTDTPVEPTTHLDSDSFKDANGTVFKYRYQETEETEEIEVEPTLQTQVIDDLQPTVNQPIQVQPLVDSTPEVTTNSTTASPIPINLSPNSLN